MARSGRFWKEQLRSLVQGRRWLLAIDVAAAARPTTQLLAELGAERSFVLAAARGIGELPDPAHAEVVNLDVRSETIMTQIRAANHAVCHPPSEVVAQIEAWDPDASARVIGPVFGTGEPVCGRACFGQRPASWQVLEDKVIVDALWDEIGVRRAPSRVVEAQGAALRAAAAEIDPGAGTVWAGDAREGFNGAGEYARIVWPGDDTADAEGFFAAHCDRVRVMPFLEGIPCSIHGMAFDDYVAAFRPCEMLVFTQPGSQRFRYATAATFWDPPDADAEEMRAIARAVGEHLREQVDYRGAFTIDGVMTREGFLPTELNPRYGAALSRVTAGIEGLPLTMLNFARIEGEPLDWQPHALEALIRDGADAVRAGSGVALCEREGIEDEEVHLAMGDHGCSEVGKGQPWDLRLHIGPGMTGSVLRVFLSPDRTPVGPSAAPRMAAALHWADARWGLDIGRLEPAVDVRAAR